MASSSMNTPQLESIGSKLTKQQKKKLEKAEKAKNKEESRKGLKYFFTNMFTSKSSTSKATPKNKSKEKGKAIKNSSTLKTISETTQEDNPSANDSDVSVAKQEEVCIEKINTETVENVHKEGIDLTHKNKQNTTVAVQNHQNTLNSDEYDENESLGLSPSEQSSTQSTDIPDTKKTAENGSEITENIVSKNVIGDAPAKSASVTPSDQSSIHSADSENTTTAENVNIVQITVADIEAIESRNVIGDAPDDIDELDQGSSPSQFTNSQEDLDEEATNAPTVVNSLHSTEVHVNAAQLEQVPHLTNPDRNPAMDDPALNVNVSSEEFLVRNKSTMNFDRNISSSTVTVLEKEDMPLQKSRHELQNKDMTDIIVNLARKLSTKIFNSKDHLDENSTSKLNDVVVPAVVTKENDDQQPVPTI